MEGMFQHPGLRLPHLGSLLSLSPLRTRRTSRSLQVEAAVNSQAHLSPPRCPPGAHTHTCTHTHTCVHTHTHTHTCACTGTVAEADSQMGEPVQLYQLLKY